jgi:hypothetical protein
MRCLMIYSGIHYDAATLAPVVDAPADWHQTLFPIVRLVASILSWADVTCSSNR